ncbi:hypothetical protein BYT27DRAFT_7145453 [Phlegmacium glaucopus]|nr:hypothetical protein BYT27DRAFT_7145453 [Phlegmacium glaucopus]
MSLAHVDLHATIGALQIGSIISVFLFGIITLQAHMYYTSFQEDRWSFKALVAVVWIMEVLHTAGVNYIIYNSTITLYGEPQELVRFPVLGGIIIVGGLITFSSQGFFAVRLYTILPKPYCIIGIFCIFLSAVRCVASVFLAVQTIIAPTLASTEMQWKWLISTLLAGGAAVDVIIAVSMLHYLSRTREKALERATRLIDYLIAYTIRTGSLTSVSAVTVVICFQLMPSNFVWLAIYTCLAKLYTNSLYSALNSRKEMRQNIQDSSYSVEPSRSRRRSFLRNSPRPIQIGRTNFQPISIEMNVTTGTTRDGDTLDEKSETLSSPSQPTTLYSAF